MKTTAVFLLLALTISACSQSQSQTQPSTARQQYLTEKNIQYYSDAINHTDPYIASQCVLDCYYPKGIKNFSTIIWFHGGSLTGGAKEIPKALISPATAKWNCWVAMKKMPTCCA